MAYAEKLMVKNSNQVAILPDALQVVRNLQS
jgi:hypothetical protein